MLTIRTEGLALGSAGTESDVGVIPSPLAGMTGSGNTLVRNR